jgi:hypothetical protein
LPISVAFRSSRNDGMHTSSNTARRRIGRIAFVKANASRSVRRVSCCIRSRKAEFFRNGNASLLVRTQRKVIVLGTLLEPARRFSLHDALNARVQYPGQGDKGSLQFTLHGNGRICANARRREVRGRLLRLMRLMS